MQLLSLLGDRFLVLPTSPSSQNALCVCEFKEPLGGMTVFQHPHLVLLASVAK